MDCSINLTEPTVVHLTGCQKKYLASVKRVDENKAEMMAPEKQEKCVDYRFTLANERTFLAWIRTALAFMAGGIGIDQLAADLAPAVYRIGLVIGMSLTAAGLAWYGYRRWAANESAIGANLALPPPRLLLWLSTGLAVGMVLTLLVMVMK